MSDILLWVTLFEDIPIYLDSAVGVWCNSTKHAHVNLQ